MREATIEARLREGVNELGGRAYKFVSPGNAGVPDRLIVLPGGRVVFVELKTDSGRLSRMQIYRVEELRHMGAQVHVLHGMAEVEEFLKLVSEGGGI